MFTFQCDACQKEGTGTTRNEAILSIQHSKRCEDRHGIPIHYTRVNKAQTEYVCEPCDSEDHKNCTGTNSKGDACECCYERNF